MAKKDKPRNILVSRLSALGDVAMTIPVIYGACKANSDANFVVLTKKLPARLFLNPPANLTVIGIDTGMYEGLSGLRRLTKEIVNDFGIDLIIDLHDVLRTKIIRLFARLRGVPSVHIRKGRREKKSLTRHSSKEPVRLKPMEQRYRETFLRAGIATESQFSIFPDGKADPSIFVKVSGPKKNGERWLAIAPFAAHKGKIYPLSLMQKVIDHYAAMPLTKIFIFGAGAQEETDIERLARGRRNVISMAKAKAGMEGELAIMSHCDTMLAMDSANMHMASLVGLRTVSIWGATHPYAGFYGRRQNLDDAVQLEMECRPCSVFGNKPCMRGDYPCLSGISPQLIISRIDAKDKHNQK